jgi:hypothetical protein
VLFLPDKGEEGQAIEHARKFYIKGAVARLPRDLDVKDTADIFKLSRDRLTEFIEEETKWI